jgi:hypothetical protein
MKTSQNRKVSLVLAVAGLMAGAAGCGADASDMGRAPQRASRLGAEVPPSSFSTARVAQLDAIDPSSIGRASERAPNDPPPRPTSKEACDACQGLWGVHGVEEVETCICKTNDEGRECTDGNDCQGECLLDGDAQLNVMDQGDPPRGYFKGYCAGYDTTFGCFRHIPEDIQSQLPLVAEEAGPNICVD